VHFDVLTTISPVTNSAVGILSAIDRAPQPRTLLDILRDTTARYPEASALDDGSGALSYRELMARVIQTASRLNAAGVKRGDRVGIRMPSGARELYISILGIITAGAAYVPVDADDPDERADLVFSEARVCGVITDNGEFTATAGSLVFDEGARHHDSPTAHLFEGAPAHPSTSSHAILQPPRPEDDAWIIFTSGSTGTPKGVAVSHRSAAAFVDAEARLFLAGEPLGTSDRVLAGLSVAFDASCEEMWLAHRTRHHCRINGAHSCLPVASRFAGECSPADLRG
jgi:non-ribosomal peptide synthetase component F